MRKKMLSKRTNRLHLPFIGKTSLYQKKSSLKSLKFFCFQKSRLVLQLLVFTEITTIKVSAEAIIKFAVNHECCLISNACFSCTCCDRWSLFCSPIFISLFGTNILKVYEQWIHSLFSCLVSNEVRIQNCFIFLKYLQNFGMFRVHFTV